MMAETEQVVACRNQLGEGCRWDDRTGTLYWVDIDGQELHQLVPASGDHQVYPTPEPVTALGLRSQGGLVVTLASGYATWDPAQQQFTRLAQPTLDLANVRFNDGAIDPQGRFYAGIYSKRGHYEGDLYRLDPDGTLHTMDHGFACANGMGWNQDHTVMYVTESSNRSLYAYDYDEATGVIANRRVFFQMDEADHTPDGMAIDSEGCFWHACWDGWQIIRHDPAGKVMQRYPVPVQRPTCCVFGGPDLTTLYITSATENLSEADIAQQPLAGSLLCIKTEVRGLPAWQFNG